MLYYKYMKKLTVVIGGDIDSDLNEILYSGKSIKELNQSKNSLYLENYEQFYKLLSPKKLDILLFLMKSKTKKSVSEIAEKTKRLQEAVSRDLSKMKDLGIIEIKKEKNFAYISPNFKTIEIKLQI